MSFEGIERIIRKGRKVVASASSRLETLKVQYVPVDAVKPNSYNPNRQTDKDFDLLLRSMREDGFTQPIIVHADSKMIVDGEHRWRAARELGLPEVPVVFVDMSDEQMRVSTLRHNRARGSEDVDRGAQVLRDLRELGALEWAKDSLAIDDKELEMMLEDVDAAQQLAADDFGLRMAEAESKNGRSSVSDAMVKRSEQAVRDMQAATSDAQRREIEMEARRWTYRVVLNFLEADGEVVRQVLEPKPAQRLLELCREWKANHEKEGM